VKIKSASEEECQEGNCCSGAGNRGGGGDGSPGEAKAQNQPRAPPTFA